MEKSEEKFSSEDVWGVCVREKVIYNSFYYLYHLGGA